LYNIISELTSEFRNSYDNLPENIDEGNEWYAYLEFMNFRTIPSVDTWIFNQDQAHAGNLELFLTVKGIIHTVAVVPEPQARSQMDSVFKAYAEHINNLNEIIVKKISHSNVFRLQKEYVSVYEESSRIKEVLKKSKEFYEKIKKNMYSSIFVPKILK